MVKRALGYLNQSHNISATCRVEKNIYATSELEFSSHVVQPWQF